VGVLEHLEQHLDDVAHLHALRAVRVVELVQVDGARPLVADVDDDVLAADLHDDAADHFLLAEAPGLALQGRQELLALRAVVLGKPRVQHGDAAHLLGGLAPDDCF
jgi:hypothetical protein